MLLGVLLGWIRRVTTVLRRHLLVVAVARVAAADRVMALLVLIVWRRCSVALLAMIIGSGILAAVLRLTVLWLLVMLLVRVIIWRLDASVALLRRIVALALVLLLTIIITTAPVLVVWGTSVVRHGSNRVQ